MQEGENEPLLDRRAAAKYLRLKNHNTLSVWDCTKRYDLNPIKVGGAVRYRKSSLDAWLISRTVRKGRK